MNTHPLQYADQLAHQHHEQLIQTAEDDRLRASITPDRRPSSVPSTFRRRRLRFAAALGAVSAITVGGVALNASASVGDDPPQRTPVVTDVQPSDRLVVDRYLVAV